MMMGNKGTNGVINMRNNSLCRRVLRDSIPSSRVIAKCEYCAKSVKNQIEYTPENRRNQTDNETADNHSTIILSSTRTKRNGFLQGGFKVRPNTLDLLQLVLLKAAQYLSRISNGEYTGIRTKRQVFVASGNQALSWRAGVRKTGRSDNLYGIICAVLMGAGWSKE
jgi:hypothetical protein